MGCRHDYVGITAGVPQLADDLLRRSSLQQRAISGPPPGYAPGWVGAYATSNERANFTLRIGRRSGPLEQVIAVTGEHHNCALGRVATTRLLAGAGRQY